MSSSQQVNVRISPEQAFAIISSMDLSKIHNRMVSKGECDPAVSEAVMVEYRKFISISAAYASQDHRIAISSKVDPAWHTHILFTQEYKKMCEAIGVEFFHHLPAEKESLSDLEADYANTLSAYNKHFGKPPEEFWPKNDQICGVGGCACSGTGNE